MPRYRTAHTLTEAIYRESWDRVDTLLELGGDPNQAAATHSKDRSLPTLPLTMAIQKTNANVAKRLIKAGAAPDGAAGYISPMSAAISKGRLDLVQLLVAHGADPHAKTGNSFIKNHLEAACDRSCVDIAAYLMQMGVRPGDRPDGSTLFHLVMPHAIRENNNKAMIRLLLDKGVDPLAAARTKHGKIDPITYAALYDDGEVVAWFLDAGGDPNLVNHYHMSNLETEHLSLAAIVVLRSAPGQEQVLRTLAGYGANLDARVDFNLNTLGLSAHMHGQDQTYDSGERRMRNMSLLTLAAAIGQVDCTRFLLEHGLDPNDQGARLTTPLHIAIRAADQADKPKFRETLQLLLEAGADPNARDDLGNTPLHYLAERMANHGPVQDDRMMGLVQMAKLLLDHGVDSEIANKNGARPLDLARTKACGNPGFDVLVSYADKLSMERTTPQADNIGRRPRI